MNKIILITLIFIGFNTYLFSQSKVGEVKVYPISLEERNDSLYLEMDIRVWSKAMNPCQSWTILPELVTEDNRQVYQLPHILINGKSKAQIFRRKAKYGSRKQLESYPHIKFDVYPYRDTTFKYKVALPYEAWMDTSSLTIHQILTSCADKDQWFTFERMFNVALPYHEPYTVNPKVNYVTPVKETKQRAMQGQAYLDFQVGRSVIIPTFRRNPEELAKIDATINSVRSNNDVQILGIYIEGYASPEGRYDLNEKLSRDRAIALKDYIKSKHNFPENLFRVTSVAEDWDGLRIMVENSDIEGKERVLEIINGTDIFDGREKKLMDLMGGRPYRKMLAEMFPQLRRVEYQVDFSVKEYSLEESKSIIGRNPEFLSQYELFLLAQTYGLDKKEGQDVLEIILRHYPDDEVANINMASLMLLNHEYATAKRSLDKAGDNVQAYNNWGVYYMLTGELDKAEEYFLKAKSIGVKEADDNLEEVRLKRADDKKLERYKNRK